VSLGLTVTPWWFINGVGFKGKLDDDRLGEIVAAERGYVDELIANGVRRDEVYDHLQRGATRPLAPAPAESPLDPDGRYAVPVVDHDLSFGPVDAPVTVVVFGDVECPSTRKLWRALDRVGARHHGLLRIVIKHDPLPRYPHALDAHLALAAARRWGRGEALFERLIRGDGLRDRHELLAEAARAGIDPQALVSAMEDPDIVDEVRADRHLAARFGVAATPTFFINGRPIIGVIHPDRLDEVVADELAAVQAMSPGNGTIYERAVAGALGEAVPPRRAGPALDLAPPVVVPITADDPVRGPADAPVTVVAYMDFECPHSADAAAALERLRARHGGRFWEMHDWLFAHQATLDRASIEAALETLGIDRTRFTRDFEDAAVTDRAILAAEADGKALGFTGTPTLVVNGQVVPGLVDDDLLDELVEGAGAW
jgi:protein-disulfide isomerase